MQYDDYKLKEFYEEGGREKRRADSTSIMGSENAIQKELKCKLKSEEKVLTR